MALSTHTILTPHLDSAPARRVLIVEDEMLIGWDATSTLVDAGFEVVLAVDGAQGLDAAMGQRFDLIITDYVMPKLNGLELIRALRDRGVEAPIILTTSMERSSLEAGDARFDCFVSKPYNMKNLIALARRFTADVAEKKISGRETLAA